MTHLVVVGASLAGLRAVEAVRGDGFDGTVTLVGAEEHLPYDRPPLSKEYLAAEECPDPRYREHATFADDLDVELVLGTPASALDTSARTVTVGDRSISYDGLVDRDRAPTPAPCPAPRGSRACSRRAHARRRLARCAGPCGTATGS